MAKRILMLLLFTIKDEINAFIVETSNTDVPQDFMMWNI